MGEATPWPSDYAPRQESAHTLFHLDLGAFSGPLDLLLLLVRRHQLDILDIPMERICRDYLACLRDMEGLCLDVAAEFMALAAELLSIKSRMLLPRPEAPVDEDDEAAACDPRAALVARLLEHQKYCRAAADLEALPRLGRDVFPTRPPQGEVGPQATGALRPARVFQLAQVFHQILRRQRQEEPHTVRVEAASVKTRMSALIEALAASPRLSFAGMVADLTRRIDLVVTFLALLELTRMKLCGLWAGGEEREPDLWVEAAFTSVDAALSRVAGAEEQFA